MNSYREEFTASNFEVLVLTSLHLLLLTPKNDMKSNNIDLRRVSRNVSRNIHTEAVDAMFRVYHLSLLYTVDVTINSEGNDHSVMNTVYIFRNRQQIGF